MVMSYRSYYEFDMQILECCKIWRNKSDICRSLIPGPYDFDLVGKRVNVLVKQGLLMDCYMDRPRLNGKRYHSTTYYILTDSGSQTLFHYRTSKKFYDAVQVKEVDRC